MSAERKRDFGAIRMRPLTEDEKNLLDCNPIVLQFPLIFKNGAEVGNFVGLCARCRKQITDSELRGRVNKYFAGVVVIDAIGYCKECNLQTVYKVRVRDDMSMDTLTERGEWATYDFLPEDRLDRWKQRLVKVMQRILTILSAWYLPVSIAILLYITIKMRLS